MEEPKIPSNQDRHGDSNKLEWIWSVARFLLVLRVSAGHGQAVQFYI
jgi:hypothetical protein